MATLIQLNQPKRKNVFVVGLTGGIGSGKSTVATLFAKLGVPVIDADTISHAITQRDGVAYDAIIHHFGKDILHTDKTIDRRKLRHFVFENPSEKKWLENLLHPLIRQSMKQRIEATQKPYCICVIPLLAESKGIDFIDRVLVIDTPIEIQLARAKKRDAASHDEIQKIIQSQANRSARIDIADDVLTNDGDLSALNHQVSQLNTLYLELARFK